MSKLDQTSISLGAGEALIVDMPIEETRDLLNKAMHARQLVHVTDVRDPEREMWLNPNAWTILQEAGAAPCE